MKRNLNLTNKQRVERVLLGQEVDRVPFTIYANKLKAGSIERQLRNMGLCLIDRSISVFKPHHSEMNITKSQYEKDGQSFVRIDYDTPLGNFHTINKDLGYTSWCEKHMFSSSEDYKKIKYWIDNSEYQENYKALINAQEVAGDDVFFRPYLGNEPLQSIILFMGTERFCIEWMENRDEIMKLYKSLVSAVRRRYKIIAESPALAFNYGGNVIVEVIGPKVFDELYIPNYNEAAEQLHKTGKLIGSHMDGNCKILAKALAESQLDYIEAFSPAPDTDMTLADGIKAWPDKCLWINFPSSAHLNSQKEIAQTTKEILETACSHERFILGITETIPANRMLANLLTICETINDYYEATQN